MTSSRELTQKTKVIPSKESISVYANHVFFALSTVWDMRIVFGQVRKVEDTELLVEERASVTMPLAVAKILALGIQANITQYEKATGKAVDLPPGMAFGQTTDNSEVNIPATPETK